MFIHLIPEELACLRSICIIESVKISLSDPVTDAVFIGLVVHPSVVIEFLVVFGIDIELRPYRDHHPSVHVMDGIYHRLRIRESCRIELMASPRILFPMAPVHHDIINREIPLAETCQSIDHFCRSLVTLTALPVSHCPFRHDRSLSCKGSVSADDFICIFTGDKIPVHLLGHLTPP